VAAFLPSMKREVNSLAKRLKVSRPRAFNIWFARIALELDEEEAIDASGIDGSNDKGIDLFQVDKERQKIIIAQGKYGKGDGDFRPKVSQVDSLLSSVNWLASPQSLVSEGRADLAESAKEYLEAVREGYSVEFWFAYAGPKCANVDKHIEVYNQNTDNATSEPPKTCNHCHVGLLERNYNETIGKAKRLESETIVLVNGRHFEYDAEFGEALIGTMPASELVRIYEKYEDRLFDRNVRLFLGARKGSINAGIAETLRSSDRVNFWAYNNGLTLVCSTFSVRDSRVRVEEFCIVNGCQSTRSLVDNRGEIDESVNVLVRVLAVSNDLVDSVIRFTNSQNPIRAWDIASQHKTQRRLRNEFADLPQPYMYVTRRGDQPKSPELAKFRNGGKPRQIKLAEVGQYVAALAGDPVLAYKDKALIFSSKHDRVFPADIKVEEVLFAYVCGEQAKEVVSRYRGNKADDKEAKILTKGGHLFTMAVLGLVAKLRNGNAYLTQLSQEQITSNLGKARQRKYAEYALQSYLRAVKDAAENRGQEIATLLRSRDFFDIVSDRVKSQYETNALAGEEWVKKALPRLV